MSERACPGLPADWLNGWLAALGATVLVPEMTLRWTDDVVPLAVLAMPGGADVSEAIGSSLPTRADLDAFPFVRHYKGSESLGLNPTEKAWRQRVPLCRADPATAWTITSQYTDLAWDRRESRHVIGRGQFLTPMQGKTNTLYDRVVKLVEVLDRAEVSGSIDGNGRRVQANGLGFDLGRIGSLGDESQKLVDPVVESLAFFGLSLFPVRGDGRGPGRQRGWSGRQDQSGAFRWLSWMEPLDAMGVDALLDLPGRQWPLLGVNGVWETVAFKGNGKDVSVGLGSRRVQ